MMNANYYRIRNAIIRGLSDEEIEITDKELIKYKRVIDSFTPQQMGIFQLLVEQGAVRKSNENLDRFAVSVNRAINGYLAEELNTWDEVLEASEKISVYLINDSEMEVKLFREHKGDLEKMGAALKKTLEIVENRAKDLIAKEVNQKQAIQELKDEFPEISNSLISSTYKRVLKESEEILGNKTEVIVMDEASVIQEEPKVEAKEDVAEVVTEIVTNNETSEETKLRIVNKILDIEGENGSYRVDRNGVRLDLPENVLQFENIEVFNSFVNEVLEVFRMV